MSTATGPSQPASDNKAASIAWAIAAIVVALVVAFIAWLAMGDQDGSGTADAESSPTTTAQDVEDTEGTEDQGAGSGEDAQAPAQDLPQGPPDAEEQTPPEEVEEFMLSLQRRDADDVMSVGDVDAPVVMIEYADYRCPYCARFHLDTRPELMSLVEDGTLRIEFRDLVIFDETSLMAAIGGRAAAEQGLLEEYQSAVFARSSEGRAELTREDLVAMAEEVGVPDLEAFEASLEDPELAAKAQKDTSEARSLGVSSTPTFIVNTAVVQGAQDAGFFRNVIEQEKAKAAEKD